MDEQDLCNLFVKKKKSSTLSIFTLLEEIRESLLIVSKESLSLFDKFEVVERKVRRRESRKKVEPIKTARGKIKKKGQEREDD